MADSTPSLSRRGARPYDARSRQASENPLIDWGVSFSYAVLIGFFLGFAFGVGCALAVMYSIYMGGYRAAIRDSRLAHPPDRFSRAQAAHKTGMH